MENNLKKYYTDKVRLTLKEKFNYKNSHEIPKISKITINRGLGLNAQNKSILQKSIDELKFISGQKPITTYAKKSIAGFKLREKAPIGISVTLRDKRMYSFLERLNHLVLPRIRDFRGLNPESFDNNGNYNLGLEDQLVFPEIEYDQVDKLRGFNITIVTTAKTKEEGFELLKEIGIPFKLNENIN